MANRRYNTQTRKMFNSGSEKPKPVGSSPNKRRETPSEKNARARKQFKRSEYNITSAGGTKKSAQELKMAEGKSKLYQAAEKNDKKSFKKFKSPKRAMDFYQKYGDKAKGRGAYNIGGKAISKSQNPGLVKLAKKKPELAKKFGYDKNRIVAKEGGKMMKRKMFASGNSPFDKKKTTLKDPFTDPMMKILEEMKKLSNMKSKPKDLPKKK